MTHKLSYDNYTKSKRHYVFNSIVLLYFLENITMRRIFKRINEELGTLHMVTPHNLKTIVNTLITDNLIGHFTYIEGNIENNIFIFDVDQEKYIDVKEYNVGESSEEFVLFRILETIYSPTEIFYIVNEIEGNKTNKKNLKVKDIRIDDLDRLLTYSTYSSKNYVKRNKFVDNPICTTARNRFFGKTFNRALEMYKPSSKAKEHPELHLLSHCSEEITKQQGIPYSMIQDMSEHFGISINIGNVEKRNNDSIYNNVKPDSDSLHAFYEQIENIMKIVPNKYDDIFVVTNNNFIQAYKQYNRSLKIYDDKSKNPKYIIVTDTYDILDNLDVLQVTFCQDSPKLENVMKWPTYKSEGWNKNPKCKTCNGKEKRLYLMRHCSSCNEHPNATDVPRRWFDYSTRIAMCSPLIKEELRIASYKLRNILRPNTYMAASLDMPSILTAMILIDNMGNLSK